MYYKPKGKTGQDSQGRRGEKGDLEEKKKGGRGWFWCKNIEKCKEQSGGSPFHWAVGELGKSVKKFVRGKGEKR